MRIAVALCAVSLFAASARAESSWPDLAAAAKAIGGGEHDAAVVVGVENYFAVPGVPGAKSNAGRWYVYLTETRGVPPQNVKLLTDADATREEILGAAAKAAGQAGADGTLWFVFVGHGAPAADGRDGLLVGVDAQQKAESLQARGVRRGELLKALAAGPAGSIRVVLDACFSGRGPDGATIAPGLQPLLTVSAAGALDPRMAVLTAAKGDQFAGALPGESRPAFSYLVLGGLRGWAAGADGKVTAGSLLSYARNALAATLRGRDQTPDLLGPESAFVAASAGEKGPNLAKLAKATAGGGAFQVNAGALPRVPAAPRPEAGIDFGAVDVEGLGKYDEAVKYDKGGAAPESKAAMWKALAEKYPGFKPMADSRVREWERYAAELAAAAAAKEKRAELMAEDWAKLSKLLSYSVVGAADKRKSALAFVTAYGRTSELNPYLAELKPYLPAGTLKAAPAAAGLVKDIQWVTIPGGSFLMGADGEDESERPVHRVSVKSFQLAKTEVTNGQYKACVKAGACSPPRDLDTHAVKYVGGDDHPMADVDWVQSKKFSEWAGGRLPTEAEWEYAARSGGKERKYPWGDAEPTCDLAVTEGCSAGSEPVCSKPAGNTEQGLCDMGGNVMEWTHDWYHASYQGAPTDGSAWLTPRETRRVYRGGTWDGSGKITRSTWRYALPMDNWGPSIGFRPARSL